MKRGERDGGGCSCGGCWEESMRHGLICSEPQSTSTPALSRARTQLRVDRFVIPEVVYSGVVGFHLDRSIKIWYSPCHFRLLSVGDFLNFIFQI